MGDAGAGRVGRSGSKQDLSASFKAAAKHLFRHLHYARALRSNPLVSQLFESAAGSGLSSIRDERAVLSRIHELVRLGAIFYRDLDIAAGKTERAQRQYAIITLQCLGQRAIREVASALGISYYHCYRERATICRRVAAYISERTWAATLDYHPELDEFGLLLHHMRDQGKFSDAEGVGHASFELGRLAGSVDRQIEALRIGALLAMDFGDLAGAETAYAAAQGLLTRHSGDPAKYLEPAVASADLLCSAIAYERGESSKALLTAERANTRLAAVQETAAPHVRELYTESLFDLAVASWSQGDTTTGYDYLVRAESSVHRAPAMSAWLRTRVRASVWKLRNYLLLSSACWYPAWQRLEGLLSAFQEAYGAGSISSAIEVLVLLTEHHAFARSDDEALRYARFAIRLAEQRGSELARRKTAIEVCARLLSTRHWRYASSTLIGFERRSDLGAYHRQLLSHFSAERFVRLRRFHDALNVLDSKAPRTGAATLTVRTQLIAAAAAHGLDQGQRARALIESAIPAAEELASAPILRDAYRLAARITGESRFKRRAGEVARLITA